MSLQIVVFGFTNHPSESILWTIQHDVHHWDATWTSIYPSPAPISFQVADVAADFPPHCGKMHGGDSKFFSTYKARDQVSRALPSCGCSYYRLPRHDHVTWDWWFANGSSAFFEYVWDSLVCSSCSAFTCHNLCSINCKLMTVTLPNIAIVYLEPSNIFIPTRLAECF